ncbi:pilus assembly protein [Variovorax sp. MHTC-1]|uniref:pilus assembly protein n=1 Tax=Variovorax sp. MHTC-1 TaxID=2495593 RepID=UPI000F885DA2|nr:PilC/PilY family type IV pilus protein [Variovorax sp. MHTC-1]RST51859.1 pilus assembly protein [Variovorax sp. MHTC-1]
MTRVFRRSSTRVSRAGVIAAAWLGLSCTAVLAAATKLADQPVFATADVPGNLLLALSVEFPTAISVANLNDYADATEYLGYFDPRKCYVYKYVEPAVKDGPASNSYFQPAGAATGSNKHSCSGQWSGNFMNWAAMQTIDPFRWALSGGYRSVDTTSETILEKAWGSSQGTIANFPLRGTDQPTGHKLPSSLIASVTPFSRWDSFNSSIWSRGNTMVFTGTGDLNGTGADLSDVDRANRSKKEDSVYRVYVRVKVCDAKPEGGGVEANCVRYGSSYKPEGLLQQNANKIRYGTFSFLNADGETQQGGVMRAPMGFIGPTYPKPLSNAVVTNTRSEWDPATGIMHTNPDRASAKASSVAQSGVMNYLNKFGEAAKSYMTNDNVSELYYAAVRYFEKLGNVPEWTDSVAPGAENRDARLDGFPAVIDWKDEDPIAYSCQKNFILGIGDDHTHHDYNVGGSLVRRGRPIPAEVAADTFNKADDWTKSVQTLEGMALTNWVKNGAGSSTFIAGLAYGAHINDIRPDLPGVQNISTYWMDVMEFQRAEDRNPYYLAAKYGGFSVPAGYDTANTKTALKQNWWNMSGDTIDMNGKSRLRPDNYFLAGNARQMVSGLKSAFTDIANAIKAFTTSFSLSTAQASSSGNASYASQYDSKGWTGVVTASTITFASDGTPSAAPAWSTSTTLEAQLANGGWDTARRVATWDGSKGVAFRAGALTSAQLAALTPAYAIGNTSTDYLNYLRGDRKNEATSAVAGSTKALRSRALLLGDIVDAKVMPVGPPSTNYSENSSPGYAAFKARWAGRPTMVYAGGNDGMLHAFNGTLTGATAGTEQFAYVPSALFQGPNGTPQVDGLVQIGNPNYVHHYYVDATPLAFDIDLNSAGGAFTTTSNGSNANWHTLLIGGLGKGGKSFYAIDVTDPAGMTSEAAVAGKVRWEFSDATMGYSYGAPTVVKTKKYGWVVMLTSGYNNSDGKGYLYIVNPKTGALLEKMQTPTSSNGLVHASAYVADRADHTADAVYAADLDGQLWRFDLTAPKGSTAAYPAPTLLATLTDASGAAQPVTTAPLIEINPVTRKRFVLLGTGKLLDPSDVNSKAPQSFYAIVDGTAGSFNAVGSAITRARLTQVTDVTTGATLSSTSMGWYLDLDVDTAVSWRMVSTPATYSGVVAFSSLLTTGDACSPSGQSRVFAINYGTGRSVLLSAPDGYAAISSAVTDLRFVGVDGSPRLIAGTTKGDIAKIPTDLKSGISLRLLNWREVPAVN